MKTRISVIALMFLCALSVCLPAHASPPAATVSGKVLVGSAGQKNVTVWIDVANSGQPGGALWTVTGADGSYSISSPVAIAGSPVREVPPAGYGQSVPANGFGVHVTVALGATTAANFTNVPASAPIAVPTQVPAPSPATTQAAFSFPPLRIGINGEIPPAGHAVHIDQDFTDDWRSHNMTISVTAPGGASLGTLPGPTTAFLCSDAGIYTIKEIIDGAIRESLFAVPPHTRTAVAISNGQPIPAIKSHTELHLAAGTFTNQPINFSGLEDVVIIGAGPTTTLSGASLFSYWTNSKDITVENLRVDSPVVNGKATGNFGTVRGTNIGFVNVVAGHLGDVIATNTGGTIGCFASGVTEESPTEILGRLFFFVDDTDVVVINSTATGSVNESPFRTTGDTTGTNVGISRGSIYNCNFSQPTTTAKAAMTIRQADKLLISHCNFTNADLSNDAAHTGNSSVTGLWVDNVTTSNCMIEVKPNVSDAIYSNLDLHPGTTECISYSAGLGKKVIIRNATGHGSVALLKVYGAGDPILAGDWYPTVKGVPVAKNDQQQVLNYAGVVVH